jgi:hypothetical protein
VKRPFLLLLFPLFSANAFAWGCKGHEAVALTAWHFMSDNAKRMTVQLESFFPPDPALNHYCKGDEELLPIARVATWADDYRYTAEGKSTVNWHFLDVPLGQPVGDGLGYCEQGCITQAVSSQNAVLSQAPSGLTDANAKALRFLIHFLGDLHQPLHASDNKDLGGNCVPVQYLLTPVVLSGGKYTPELHAVWDDNLVEAAMNASSVKDVNAFSVVLTQMASQNRAAWSSGSPAEWIAEAHDIAGRVAYGDLTSAVSTPNLAAAMKGADDQKGCSDQHYDKRLYDLGLQVNFEYLRDAVPVVDQQLAKAGLRLANLLNAVWPGPQ